MMAFSAFISIFFGKCVSLKANAVLIFALVSAFACIVPAQAASKTPGGAVEARSVIKAAMKLNRAGKFTEAETQLRGLVAVQPDNADAKVELGFTLTKQKRLSEAYDLVVPVIEANPQNARALSVVGIILLSAGRFDDAKAAFFRAVELDRSQDLAYAGNGLLLYYENRIQQGLSDMRKAVSLRPNEPDYYYSLGQIATRAENYKEASTAYGKFLQVSNITDRDRRERIKGLINFLTFLGERSELYERSGEQSSVIHFDLVGDRPIIEVNINGRSRPLRFVLDTGSGMSVLSKKTADEFGIREVARGGFGRGIGGDGRFEIIYGFLRSLDIGDVRIKSIPVYIREFQDSSSQVDGYIGLSLISKFLTTIDYGSKTFSLIRQPDEKGKDAATAADEDISDDSLPLRLTSSGFLSGEVALDGSDRRLNFIVDTGASVSVISDLVAANDDIKTTLANDGRKITVVGSAGITDNVPSYILQKVTFGQYSRDKVLAIAISLDVINESAGFDQLGILGGNFLKNYKLTFDFRKSRVTFSPVSKEN